MPTGARVKAIGDKDSAGLGAIYGEKNENVPRTSYGEGIALMGKALFFTSSMKKALGRVDLATGAIDADAIPLAGYASGLCALDANRLLTCIDGRVVAVDFATKTVKPFITGDLVHPARSRATRRARFMFQITDWVWIRSRNSAPTGSCSRPSE